MNLARIVTTPAPWETELYRHVMVESMGDTLPIAFLDTTAAAVSSLFRPIWFHSTGAAVANKIAEYGYSASHISLPSTTRDIFALVADPGSTGMWRRHLSYDCIVQPTGFNATASATSYLGIGMGTYGVAPPDPAVTNHNVARLVVQGNTLTWQLITHAGDGVSAQVKTALVGVTAPVLGRSQHARIVVNPGQWIRAYIDGALGAEVAALPLAPITPPFMSHGWIVTSGSVGGNVRGAFYAPRLYVMGMN